MVIMVAVKNDYALVAWAVGPYHEFSPSFGSGHPSGGAGDNTSHHTAGGDSGSGEGGGGKGSGGHGTDD